MKSSGALGVCILLFLITICPFYQQILAKEREPLVIETMGYYMPSNISGVASLDFKGIVADFLFLKFSTYLGSQIATKKKMDISEAQKIFQAVDVITDLDPWFWDAYLIGDMTLAWDFKRIDLANKLLHKATTYRTWDFKPFYYLGFNYFYFLKDNNNGAKYLMEASKLPGSPGYLSNLATRLSIYQNQVEPAILFLNELLQITQNPALKKQLETRLKTLVMLSYLEKKVKKFKKIYGVFPVKIGDLLSRGLIDTIPEDPYGGEFYILENGRVFTTSKMRFYQKTDKS